MAGAKVNVTMDEARIYAKRSNKKHLELKE